MPPGSSFRGTSETSPWAHSLRLIFHLPEPASCKTQSAYRSLVLSKADHTQDGKSEQDALPGGPEPKGSTLKLRHHLDTWPLVPCGSLHFSRLLSLCIYALCPRFGPSIPCLVPFLPLHSILQLRALRRLHGLCPLPISHEWLPILRVSASLSLPDHMLCSSPLLHSRLAPHFAAFRATSPRGQRLPLFTARLPAPCS